MSEPILTTFAKNAVDMLSAEDPTLYKLIEQEYTRQTVSLAMVASCSNEHPSVLACEGTFTSNVTAEGYPGSRFHAGCEFVDQFEQLAIDRAKQAFGAQYVNVQPHTASTANQVVTSRLVNPGETLMGMSLDAGGHLSHGAKVNISGAFYNAVGYDLDENGFIDYDQAEALAIEHKPKLIICGTTAYPRIIDWQKFRDIADKVGAYLLADITHIAGLVIAGEHPSPIDIAHITTTCTHKQLYGPRGGLIMMGKDHELPSPKGKGTLTNLMQSGLFPFTQGAPIINKIVGKARALDRANKPEFKVLAKRIVNLSRALAGAFVEEGITVVSGGSDNHIILANTMSSFGVTGIVAEKALEECNVIINKNWIPGDTLSPFVTSGIRIGTNSMAARGLDESTMKQCASLIARILKDVNVVSEKEYTLDVDKRDAYRAEVKEIAVKFPIPGYPLPSS
ncbi:Serine hydroxymethyltransferase [hydrothermal vent metagenome]|uniref:Serine hydroxymethyltransferase n=1 Tax=hydrothermal vent metagenome TaxID=652676 RepID=A0A3B0XZQ9_9ZZZZ